MKSARKVIKATKTAAVRPLHCNFYLADDIRIEQGGKPSLVGFYPDNTIVVQIPKDAPDPTKDSPVGITGLALLANFVGAVGEYDAEMEMVGVGGVPLVRTDRRKLVGNKQNINFVTRFAPMPLVGFGTYKVVIKLDGHPYNFSFRVQRGELETQQDGRVRFGSLLIDTTTPKSKSKPKAKRKAAIR